jgi:predicted  nucleic acid-binding Zn-ribbon protein
METQKDLISELNQQIEDQEAVLAGQRQEVAAKVKELQQELGGLEEKRKKLRKGVPAALLKRYEFIRQRRNGTAITPVQEGVCLGCHMNILPQQFIDLQKGVEILQCPHCQRILYWLEEIEEGEEAGAQQAS